MKAQTILRLMSSNVERIKAVEIRPNGEPVVVGGRNEQGKTALLNTVRMIFGSQREIPEMPVLDGEELAEGLIETQDYIFEIEVQPDRTSELSITPKDGSVFGGSARSLIKKMVGDLSFDPLEFARQTPAKRLDIIKQSMGLDFAQHEADRTIAYDARTNINRGLREKEAKLKGLPRHKGAPAEEVSVAELAREKERCEEINRANDKKRAAVEAKRDEAKEKAKAIADYQVSLAAAGKELEQIKIDGVAMRADIDQLVDEDVAELRQQIIDSDEVNKKVRDNAAHAELTAAVDALQTKSDGLSSKIMELDDAKARQIADAEFPVDGMSISDGDVLLDGIPFAQASTAQAFKASVDLAMAERPEIRIMLMQQGSDLDEENRDLLLRLAAEAGVQPLMEVVGNPDGCATVIIEDGNQISPEAYEEIVKSRRSKR